MADAHLAREVKHFEQSATSTERWIEQQQAAGKLDAAGQELLAKLRLYIRQCRRKLKSGKYNERSLRHWRAKITETWFGIVRKEMRG